MYKKLHDQVAIITGASSGIGAGVAKALSKAGATVVVNYPVPATKNDAEKVLKEMGHSFTLGAGVSAAQKVFNS